MVWRVCTIAVVAAHAQLAAAEAATAAKLAAQHQLEALEVIIQLNDVYHYMNTNNNAE